MKGDYVDFGKMNFDKDLNQPNSSEIDIGHWDTSKCTNYSIPIHLRHESIDINGVDLSQWSTDGCATIVEVENTSMLKYCEANNLTYWYNDYMKKHYVIASKYQHPALFDGLLD